MNKLTKALSVFLLVSMLILSLASCTLGGGDGSTTSSTQKVEEVDYAGQVKLDMNSSTVKAEVKSVKTFVDGDTTHFYVSNDVMPLGVFKARYLAVNTPESTGRIEPFGKTSSRFVKEKLSSAVSIMIESDNGTWNLDSSSSRYMAWIWYKTSENGEYRNLNIEILQNGLAIPYNAGQSRYGETCLKAVNQAKALSLYVHSGQKDPEMYDGPAIPLTLKELRMNIDEYNGKVVTFEAGVVMNSGNQSVYVEDYDEDTDMYYGMTVYYGYNLNGAGLQILSVGNLVRIVGLVQYYEAGGTYQVSDIRYNVMKPNDPLNIIKIGDGFTGAFRVTDPDQYVNGKVSIALEEDTAEFDFCELAMNASISFENLKVKKVYTTTNESSASKGAMTLTCEAPDGTVITVRTNVLHDEDKNLITKEAYENKTINVKGFVEFFLPEGQTEGQYQIKVLIPSQITVVED